VAQLKYVRSLKTNNANMFDLLISFVFGRVNLDIYRPQNTYYENSNIIQLNPTTGKYEVWRALDTTTGPFDAAKWVKDTVQESANSQFIDTYTVTSPSNPAFPLNRIWYHKTKSRGQVDPESFVVNGGA
jgi:hypothetical protein